MSAAGMPSPAALSPGPGRESVIIGLVADFKGLLRVCNLLVQGIFLDLARQKADHTRP
jgi:hypothetical protein